MDPVKLWRRDAGIALARGVRTKFGFNLNRSTVLQGKYVTLMMMIYYQKAGINIQHQKTKHP
jgi:hypothetical protein